MSVLQGKSQKKIIASTKGGWGSGKRKNGQEGEVLTMKGNKG